MTDYTATSVSLRQSALEIALNLFQRLLALACIVEGVAYWVRLLGYYPGDEWRFDLMPIYWQLTAAPLAVLYPFAAVGLWMLVSWGPVIWFLCAAAEIVMYGIFPELFGPWRGLVVFHLIVVTIYGGLRTTLFVVRRRAAD